MNRAFLIGRLTKDPDFTTTSNGVSVCSFSLAISRKIANANGEKPTDFLNIVTWRGLADNCHKFIKKGSQVAVVGSIQTRTYEAQDGTKRTITEIVADDVEFLSSKTSGGAQDTETVVEEKPKVSKLEPLGDTTNNDDLPF